MTSSPDACVGTTPMWTTAPWIGGVGPVVLGLLLMGLPACPADAQEMTGTFRGGAGGELILVLSGTGDSYTGRLTTDGATVFEVVGEGSVDEDGEVVVEGAVVGGGVADFELGWDPEDRTYGLFLTPYDASGVPRLDLASFSVVERVSDDAELDRIVALGDATRAPPVQPQRPAPPSATLAAEGIDPQLVGTWATQVMMSTPGGTVATRISMRFDPDGTMLDLGSRSMGSFPDIGLDTQAGGGDQARWRVQDGLLLVGYGGGEWLPMARYLVQGSSLLLTFGDGSTQLWERAR